MIKCLAMWLTAFSKVGGLKQKDLNLFVDIVLLTVLYMHRLVLKRLGIWNRVRDECFAGVYSVESELLDKFGEPDEVHDSLVELETSTPRRSVSMTSSEELLTESDLTPAKISYLSVDW